MTAAIAVRTASGSRSTPRPDNRDRVQREAAALGLTVFEAGRDDLIGLFTKDMTGAEDWHLVFWSGHGVLDEQHTRALFTADAHAGDQRAPCGSTICWPSCGTKRSAASTTRS